MSQPKQKSNTMKTQIFLLIFVAALATESSAQRPTNQAGEQTIYNGTPNGKSKPKANPGQKAGASDKVMADPKKTSIENSGGMNGQNRVAQTDKQMADPKATSIEVADGNEQRAPHADAQEADSKAIAIETDMSQPTRTETVNASIDFVVYPNPATDLLIVQSTNDQMYTIQLLDLSGKSVRSSSHQSGSGSIRMDVSDLPRGVYFVSLENTENRLTKKVLLT